MKNKMIRVISVLFVLLFIINSSFISLYAISYTNDVKTVSDSILLVNMDEEQVVFEKDADSRRYPASTTKIMTYIIAVENIPDLDVCVIAADIYDLHSTKERVDISSVNRVCDWVVEALKTFNK